MADIDLRCDQCGSEAAEMLLDGADSRFVCKAWPKCPPTKWGVWFPGDCLTDPTWRRVEGTHEPHLFDTQERAFEEIARLRALHPWRYEAHPFTDVDTPPPPRHAGGARPDEET